MLNTKKLFTKVLGFIKTINYAGGVSNLTFGYNSSADFPYLRWNVGTTIYQLQVQNAGLSYLKRVGNEDWQTVWSAH